MFKRKLMIFATPVLLLSTLTAGAQDRRNFNNGMYQGGRGGDYNRGYNNHYDDRRYQDNRSKFGPGTGALVGAGGGALLGGLLGGGLKGTIIGGAAGAGIGAIAGKARQNSVRNRNRDGYYR